MKAVSKLKAEGLTTLEAAPLEVSDLESVNAVRAEIGKKAEVSDILINNAGINGATFNGATPIPQTATGTSIDIFKKVYETNVYGVVQVTQEFSDLLQKSPKPRIVNVSSNQGSLTLSSDPNYKY